jgi:cation:H+ antiporter
LIFLNLLIMLGGFIYLLMGADLLVRGAVALARRANVPPIMVALTVVALGTSLPELVVSLQAVFQGYPGIVLGNVVGSNIANVLLVGGVSAIVYPLAFPGGSIRRDTLVMVMASVVFTLFCLVEGIHRPAGIILVAGLLTFMIPTIREAARSSQEAGGRAPSEAVLGLPTHRRVITVFIVGGIISLPLGARLVVDAAVEIAYSLGMSEAVVGLTIIAFSTSLPELATTMVAAYRKETEVAIGTLVGSNIFNILAILGVAALVAPDGIPVPPLFPFLDLPIMLIATLVVTGFVWLRRPIGRTAGIVMTLAYLAYMTVLFIFG